VTPGHATFLHPLSLPYDFWQIAMAAPPYASPVIPNQHHERSVSCHSGKAASAAAPSTHALCQASDEGCGRTYVGVSSRHSSPCSGFVLRSGFLRCLRCRPEHTHQHVSCHSGKPASAAAPSTHALCQASDEGCGRTYVGVSRRHSNLHSGCMRMVLHPRVRHHLKVNWAQSWPWSAALLNHISAFCLS
jgi:hypothetical protein